MALTLVDVVVVSPAAFVLGALVGFLLGRRDLERQNGRPRRPL